MVFIHGKKKLFISGFLLNGPKPHGISFLQVFGVLCTAIREIIFHRNPYRQCISAYPYGIRAYCGFWEHSIVFGTQKVNKIFCTLNSQPEVRCGKQ